MISVTATGTKPINYQWFKNGKSISGATGSSLNISIADANDSGLYSVLVENSFSTASSGSINVSVITPPVIQSKLEDEILIVGNSVEKVSQVSGSEPLVYIWSKDGDVLAGYDSNNLQLNDLNVDDSGIYTLKVSNKAGAAETSVKIDVYSELTFA